MDWTDEYRGIVDFYYWEPQHLGRAAGKKRFKDANEMHDHVNKMEVSLNHILNLFFSLYPLCKINRIGANNTHVMLGSWQLELLQREQKNLTQPDLFFVGDGKNIAIELKIGSKSNLEQIIKYIKFNQLLPAGDQKEFELIYITPHDDITKIFKEKFLSESEIVNNLNCLGVKPPKLTFITFDEFYKDLQQAHEHNSTEEKLRLGLLSYLNNRNDLKILPDNV